MEKLFYLAAACITNSANALLLVRKKGTHKFMLPGGKIDRGETPLAALIRELKEELNMDIAAHQPKFLNTYHAPAANEPGFFIESNLFRIKLDHSPALSPNAEIEEALWVSLEDCAHMDLAPLINSHVIPLWQTD